MCIRDSYNENWEQQQELTSEGSSYTLDTASLKAGTYYLLGYDPNYGTENACYAPATAKVVLTSEAPQPCQWDEGVVTTEPTCTTAGVKTFSCSVHGAVSYTHLDVYKRQSVPCSA